MSATAWHRGAHVAFATVLTASFAACSDDRGNSAAEESADPRRYCELTAEVEAQAEETFSGLGEDATEDQVADARKGLLEDVDDELSEMIDVAPPEIADDVEAYVDFFRSQMRNEATEEVSDERILSWEEANCAKDTE